jgi:tetrahydromethanopterin S-methyltransferase subunit B
MDSNTQNEVIIIKDKYEEKIKEMNTIISDLNNQLDISNSKL